MRTCGCQSDIYEMPTSTVASYLTVQKLKEKSESKKKNLNKKVSRDDVSAKSTETRIL